MRESPPPRPAAVMPPGVHNGGGGGKKVSYLWIFFFFFFLFLKGKSSRLELTSSSASHWAIATGLSTLSLYIFKYRLSMGVHIRPESIQEWQQQQQREVLPVCFTAAAPRRVPFLAPHFALSTRQRSINTSPTLRWFFFLSLFPFSSSSFFAQHHRSLAHVPFAARRAWIRPFDLSIPIVIHPPPPPTRPSPHPQQHHKSRTAGERE